MGIEKETVKNIVGLASSFLLLLMLFLQFLNPELSVTERTIKILLLLIGATIATDILLERLPIEVTVEGKKPDDDNN